MSRLRNLQELSNSRPPPTGSPKASLSPEGPGESPMPGRRPATQGSERPETSETINTSRTGTAEAVKLARAENLAAEIAAKEEALKLKKQQTVELRLRYFRKKFDEFDATGSGAIDRERTHEAFKEIGIQLDKYKINKMFDKYDEDGSGTIDFYEFAELITSFNRERYTKVFQSFDVDGSGELDADEVGKAFVQLGFEFTTEYVNELIKEFDYSEDGLIQLDEFIDMIEATLIVQEDKAEEVIVSESPWGQTWQMEVDGHGRFDEDTHKWEWPITSKLRADPGEHECVDDSPVQMPFGWRPTAFLKADGSQFRGTDSCLIVNKGWRQRGVPCRQIMWHYNEESTWEVEFKDPKTGNFEVTTGNCIPQQGEVKFRTRTLLGDARRTLRIPYASQQPLTLGDIAGELIDLAQIDPAELSIRDTAKESGNQSEIEREEREQDEAEEGDSGGQDEGEAAEGGNNIAAGGVGAERSTESLGESLSSLGSLGIEGESSTESLGLDPNALEDFRASPPTGSQILPMTSEHPEQQEEGGYREQTPRDSTRDADGREQDERGKKLFHSVPPGEAAAVEDHDESHHDKGQISPEGTEAVAAQRGFPASPLKIKVDYGPDGKGSIKYQKMVGNMKDLELKRLRNGSLKLMEERQYALLVRQVNKMDADAERLDEEARVKAEEDARFKPRGTVSWSIRVERLDESAMGMRVGVVHRSLEPGADWGDYSASNNKVWWWNSFSGSLFVGDVMVPESGNVHSMTTINQWAPSRTNPMMGVPWMEGDVLTISLELEEGEVTFARNGIPTPHRVRGVWGEVYFAVQMSAEGDSVTLLEPDADKIYRIERLVREEKERMEIARALREAKRKEALAALGLV